MATTSKFRAAFAALLLAASGSAQTTAPASLPLGPGDLVDIQVFNTPELSSRVRVAQNGNVLLPVGGTLHLAGLTPADAASAVEQRLRDGEVMLDPHVTVFVDDYSTQGITVLGEVRSPGTYTMLGQHSLYQAISAAGGTTQTAGASITLTHASAPDTPINIRVNSPNYSAVQRATQVEPGDIIVVSRAEMIYVVGDVGHPGAFYMENGEPLNVLNALALAAGLNHTAAATKASIVRKTSTGATTVPLDLNDIMKNKKPNPVLEASDILVVPRSGAKVLLETALPGATAAVTGAVTTALVLR